MESAQQSNVEASVLGACTIYPQDHVYHFQSPDRPCLLLWSLPSARVDTRPHVIGHSGNRQGSCGRSIEPPIWRRRIHRERLLRAATVQYYSSTSSIHVLRLHPPPPSPCSSERRRPTATSFSAPAPLHTHALQPTEPLCAAPPALVTTLLPRSPPTSPRSAAMAGSRNYDFLVRVLSGGAEP